MSYPIPPGRRLAYESNGTRALISHSVGADRTPYQMHPRALAALNSDVGHGLVVDSDWWSFGDAVNQYVSPNYISLVFPHPMDLDGVAVALMSNWRIQDGFFSYHDTFARLTGRIQVSTDTTNGLDGTWTTIFTKDENDTHLRINVSSRNVVNPGLNVDNFPEPPVYPDGDFAMWGAPSINEAIGSNWVPYWNWSDTQDIFGTDGPLGRGIQEVNVSNAMGIRIFFPRRPALIDAESSSGPTLYGGLFLLHLYGQEGSAASDDRLMLTNSAGSADPDLTWGDVYRFSTHQRTIRVKNTSPSDTAEDVTVSIEPTFAPAGTAPDLLALSLDGETWAPRVQLGDITSEGLSDPIYLRLHPDTVGLRSAYVVARAGRWS